MSQEENNREYYAQMISSESTWLSSARELYIAARLIEPKIIKYYDKHNFKSSKGKFTYEELMYLNIQNPYYLLIGYSLENYFKAVIVKQNKEKFYKYSKSKGRLHKYLDEHNLVNLSKRANLKLKPNHINFLEYITEFIVWSGRYNIQKFSNSKLLGLKSYMGNGIERVKELYQLLYERSGFSIHFDNSQSL